MMRVLLFSWVMHTRLLIFFFFKQKTAYEMRISDWSSDVCSSDLADPRSSGKRPLQKLNLHIVGADHQDILGADLPLHSLLVDPMLPEKRPIGLLKSICFRLRPLGTGKALNGNKT